MRGGIEKQGAQKPAGDGRVTAWTGRGGVPQGWKSRAGPSPAGRGRGRQAQPGGMRCWWARARPALADSRAPSAPPVALNAQAALSQAREHQLAAGPELPPGARPPQPAAPRPEHCEGAAAGLKAGQGPPLLALLPSADAVACTQEALLQKLNWASAELVPSTSLETSIQLCSLIRACAEALYCLRQLQH